MGAVVAERGNWFRRASAEADRWRPVCLIQPLQMQVAWAARRANASPTAV